MPKSERGCHRGSLGEIIRMEASPFQLQKFGTFANVHNVIVNAA
jgi:hypothetical protein